MLPTVRSEIVETTTTPGTTTSSSTTTTTSFDLTPASTDPTTPKIYVSTSNFRPTLPNFGQDELESEQVTENNKNPLNLIQQIPLVLAPKETSQEPEPIVSTSKPETPATTTTTVSSSTTSKTSFNIHNHLEEIASNLDPWAHIQHATKVSFSKVKIYRRSNVNSI